MKRVLSKRRLRLIVIVLAIAYPVSLLFVTLLFRFVGEGWWASAVGMFLPRLAFGLPLLLLVPALLALRERRYLWSQAAALVLLLFPLMGFVLPGPGPSVTNRGFRLMSFNVDSSISGRETVFRQIAHHDPDIVLLQESPDGTKLQESLHERYPVVETSTQFMLASRYPLVSTTNPKRLPYEDRERSPRYIKYVIRTPLGPVAFYNVHPLSPRESFYVLRGERGFTRELRSGRVFSGSAGPAIRSNSGLRELQIETFARDASSENGPTVIAGDVNQPDPSPLMAGALGDFRDAFREATWGFGYTFPGSQFKARRTPKIPWMRLDRILLKGKIAATSFAVGCAGVSDHLCIVADLREAE